MNAFDMISEPVLFEQQLCEHSHRVQQSVESIPLLTEALLAGDEEKMKTLREQVSRTRDELDQIKLAWYEQIRHMHFHSAGGPAFSQYLACQDKIVGSAQEFADLLVLRKTAVPVELHADFRALVAQIVSVNRRALSMTEELCAKSETACADGGTRDTLDTIRGVIDENSQARRLEMKFTQHVYGLEKQLDPVTILFLDKCGTVLHEVATHAVQAADHLRLMIR